MSEHENIDGVRRVFAAFNGGDKRALFEVMVRRSGDEQNRARRQRVASPADLVVATPANNQIQLEGDVPVTGVVVMVARVVPHDPVPERRNRLDFLER